MEREAKSRTRKHMYLRKNLCLGINLLVSYVSTIYPERYVDFREPIKNRLADQLVSSSD